MSVHATVSVPPSAFVLARTLAVAPDARIEVEAVVPVAERRAPYLRIVADDPDLVVDLVAAESAVVAVDPIHRGDGEATIGVRWGELRSDLLDATVETDAACVEAVASRGVWRLTFRFPTHERVTDWYRRCRERDVAVTVERLREAPPAGTPSDAAALTDPQREALRVALSAGYFAVPRGATLEAVAAELGVSDTAASQRIRRGVGSLLAASFRESVDTGG
ncbi:helix-turn-helix domain-containing protein [Halobaculum lipolyticum]|uniref:Helix-turn-helix domain-containing protein n=1 Tax=Halobaculum lipolyticum TaxID=3032001 RepID=A0ABD5W607_9EURY|nr:helix-turn-helix domain-containing protein [Halobaculum sp. DT31]